MTRAIVYRVVTVGGVRVREYLGLRRWLVGVPTSKAIEKARVFADVGHAKNAIPHWHAHCHASLAPLYFVQRIRIEVVHINAPEEVTP